MLADRLRTVYRRWVAEAERGERRTQQEVAAVLGVSPGAIGHYIAGRDLPSLDKIEALARFFGVHPGWLAFGWEPRVGVPPEAMRPLIDAAADAADAAAAPAPTPKGSRGTTRTGGG